ncbi:MAG: hypothetical protein V1820_06715 [archaeon]
MGKAGGSAKGADAPFLLFFSFLLLFLLFIVLVISPAFSGEESSAPPAGGVFNVPPKIVEITATSSSAGMETTFSVTVFDGNGGGDVCGKSACNVSCAFAEIFSVQQGGREELSCAGAACKVFGQFVAKDYSPEWEPKTSRLSAKIPFGRDAKSGRWSCSIAVSDATGAWDERSYSIYLRPESDVSRLVASYQNAFFSLILPVVTCFVLALQLLRLAVRGLSRVNWNEEREKFIQAKAHLDFLQKTISSELSERAATKGKGLFFAARELFSKGDYPGTMWIAKSALSELGADYGRVHLPRRLLSRGEKAELFIGALRKQIFARK